MSPGAIKAGRFVYLTEVDISIDNGPGINEREFVSALLDRHPDEVACVLPEPQYPEVYRNPRVHYVPAHLGNAKRYLNYLRGSKATLDKLRHEGSLSGLVFRPGGTPLLPYYLSRSTRLPVFFKKLGLHAVFGHEVTRSPLKSAISRSMLPMYRSVIQGALAADVESHTYVDWLHERFGIDRARMRVVPNGVNMKMFSPRVRGRAESSADLVGFDTVVGYVGALSRIRKVGSLLAAFAALEDADRTGLVLVGSGVDEASLKDEARALGIRDRVRFVGSVSYSEVPAWMRNFDVAVDPTAVQMLTRAGLRTASYSQKIGQYLASGLPVLAWQCRDTAFLDEERVGKTASFPNVGDLGAALQDLIRTVEGGREDMALKARKVAEQRFDSVALADRRVEWWRNVVTSHRDHVTEP